jgi:endonuclease YncB( thermonuclease family)
MAKFTVSQIIDGDTFSVRGGWKWNGNTGERVRPIGYDAPELPSHSGNAAKQELERLILNKQVELSNVATIDRGRLVCDVLLNGRNLADYFPEFRS